MSSLAKVLYMFRFATYSQALHAYDVVSSRAWIKRVFIEANHGSCLFLSATDVFTVNSVPKWIADAFVDIVREYRFTFESGVYADLGESIEDQKARVYAYYPETRNMELRHVSTFKRGYVLYFSQTAEAKMSITPEQVLATARVAFKAQVRAYELAQKLDSELIQLADAKNGAGSPAPDTSIMFDELRDLAEVSSGEAEFVQIVSDFIGFDL